MRSSTFLTWSTTLLTLSLSLPTGTHASDPRYCNNKTPLHASDFTLQESPINPHLAALASHFTSTNKNTSFANVLASSNRALIASHPPVGTGHPAESWTWNSGDVSTTKWTPQGITSSGDALGSGVYEGREAWLVTWYNSDSGENPNEGVRVSFVDRSTKKYRHVLLVEPSADENFAPVKVHAGGVMWYGNLVYVVDTNNGIRVFDLEFLWEVEDGDGIGKTKDGKGYSAAGYRYVLPQVRSYKWTPGSTSPFRFSWLSLDRSDSPDTLLVGEFVRDGELDAHNNPVPIRLVKYQLDSSTRRLRTDAHGVATASWAHCVDILRMQGGVSYGGTFYLSRSNGRDPHAGDLFTWVEGQTAKKFGGWFMAGNEDLSFSEKRGEYYTVTEYEGGRYILSYKV